MSVHIYPSIYHLIVCTCLSTYTPINPLIIVCICQSRYLLSTYLPILACTYLSVRRSISHLFSIQISQFFFLSLFHSLSWHSNQSIIAWLYLSILVYIYILATHYIWCSRYRRRKWTRRHEFKSWTWLTAFHIALIPLGKVWIQLFSLQLWVNSRIDSVLQPWLGN